MTEMSSSKRAWSEGGMVFAACMMVLLGVMQFFQGLAAIIKDSFYVVAPNYVYELDTTAWGWIHLILGALVAVTGFFLFTGADWARGVGIGLAVLSAIAQFFFLPYYPIWALVIIALDVFVIWALTVAPRPTA
ncbi:hypothetical protein HDA40_001122 [Hamadaea flava]|uniref:DUF7144 domain-containing protein n=1 Tax=Hamadaea flava TaxID=1742688 RepID=A0ABV8LP40_9ACTN|nr:hypothetical protein [Hamadaea flava]MCP2322615.1 hypothetical protein [Hamadaea flava]